MTTTVSITWEQLDALIHIVYENATPLRESEKTRSDFKCVDQWLAEADRALCDAFWAERDIDVEVINERINRRLAKQQSNQTPVVITPANQ
jgi:hypothetical protein